jgi:twinkle protein
MIAAAEKLGIDLRGATSGLINTICPECSHTRKKNRDTCLNVNLTEGWYKCWHCEWKGALNMQQDSQKQYVKQITPKKQGEYRPTQLNDLSGPAIDFFKKRGIEDRTLRLEGIKTAQKWFGKYQKEVGAIAFPFIKNNMRVNTKYRTSTKDMAQDGNAEKCFYRFDQMSKGKRIYITEGEIDALTLVQCGYSDGVTSVPDGAPNPTANNLDTKFSYFTDEAMKIFDAADEIVLVTDNDVNGKFLESELKRRIGLDKCLTIIYPEGCKDINDVLVKLGEDAVKEIIEAAKHCPVSGLKVFDDYKGEIYNLYNGVTGSYYKTGWRDMDKHLKIKTGQLNIVTGVPGSGKSEWVDDLMMNTVKEYGLKWAVFSPENYPPQVYFRKLSEKYCDKPFTEFNENDLNLSISHLSEHIKLVIDNDEDEVTIDYLFERIRTLVFRYGIKGVVIDPWNEIIHNIGAREDMYLNKVLRKIKRFIRKYDLTFWLVAHPKNPAKDKEGNYYKITAYDIAGGYAWFAKADNIFSVWRDKADVAKPVEVDIQKIKQKTDGTLGTCYFYYQFETGRYKSHHSSLDNVYVTEEDKEEITETTNW